MAIKERRRVVIEKFQKILRSGKDYTVRAMCNEVAKEVYLDCQAVMKIINKHYRSILSDEMILFLRESTYSRPEEIVKFSEKFNVCRRESILLIRYIRRRNE